MTTTSKYLQRITVSFIFFTLLNACVSDDDYAMISDLGCTTSLSPTTTITQLKAAYKGSIKPLEDQIVEAYVVSSDAGGNIFKKLYLQDKPTDPAAGIEIALNGYKLYTYFSVGKKVYIKTKELFIDNEDGVFKIGTLLERGKELRIGGIPEIRIRSHVYPSCDSLEKIEPVIFKTIDDAVTKGHLSTLVKIDSLQFIESDLGKKYADAEHKRSGIRKLIDRDQGTIILFSSGYSDFANIELPSGSGSITGILGKYKNDYQLYIMSLKDVDFANDRFNFIIQLKSIADIRKMYVRNKETKLKSIKIKGIVISDKDNGSIHKNNIVIQDASGGIQVRFKEYNTQFSRGDSLEIDVSSTILTDYRGLVQINNVNNEKVVVLSSNNKQTPRKVARISDITKDMESQLIQLANVSYPQADGTKTFSGSVTVTDAEGGQIQMYTSLNFKGLKDRVLPTGSGTITAIVGCFNTIQLNPRDPAEVAFAATPEPETGSSTVFISELADPDNNPKCRFIELYNAKDADISLEGWQLKRYTNANTTAGTPHKLSGTIAAKSTFTIAADAATFQSVYGIAPDMAANPKTVADSNGDDNIVLVNADGETVDVFGKPGEDGSNTNHEFEDGRALRLATVKKGNTTYTFSEWKIWNDTGKAGTEKKPQNAPDDFTPGAHPDSGY